MASCIAARASCITARDGGALRGLLQGMPPTGETLTPAQSMHQAVESPTANSDILALQQ